MQLIYRANVYSVTPTSVRPYVKPRALNWRYRTPGETYTASMTAQPYVKPRALNWRYRTPAETYTTSMTASCN